MALRRVVGLEARAMRAEPARMPTAAGERPVAGNAPATLDADRLRARSHAPGEHISLTAEHFARNVRREIARRHRTAGALVHAPGDRGIAAGDRFDTLNVSRGIQFRTADRARYQQTKHAPRRASSSSTSGGNWRAASMRGAAAASKGAACGRRRCDRLKCRPRARLSCRSLDGPGPDATPRAAELAK